jgi:hypothetical protein
MRMDLHTNKYELSTQAISTANNSHQNIMLSVSPWNKLFISIECMSRQSTHHQCVSPAHRVV